VIEQATYAVTLLSTGAEVPGVTGVTVRLDEGATPYLSGQITMKMPALSTVAALDPNKRPRLQIVARRLFTSGTVKTTLSTRVIVTDRTVDAAAATLTLTVANEETLLDYAPAADVNMSLYYDSIRNLVLRVLRIIMPTGGINFPLGPDAAYRPAVTARNIVPESGFEWALSGKWKQVNAAAVIIQAYAAQGVNSLRVSPANASTDSYVEIDPGLTPGRTYRISAWGSTDNGMLGEIYPGRARVLALMGNVSGVPEVLAIGSGTPITNSTPREQVIEFTIPEYAKDTTIRLYNGTNTNTNGSVYWDAVMAVEAPYVELGTPIPYFDGDTPDDATYVYTWDGQDGVSASTRTPRVERRPEALIWRQGQTAREFLNPILQAVKLRLFQDAAANWRLVDNSYLAPLRTRMDHLDNIYSATEGGGFNARHPDGSPLWADAVAITYRWLDGRGVEQERTDVAAPAGYVKLITLTLDNTPYPGPGQAEYVRSRLIMRARQMTTRGRINFNAAPSQELTILTEHTGLITGLVDSVEFDLNADEMTVVGKALVDTPATAWNQLDTGIRWSDSPVGASWASETA
jgi:hypothetical protein